MNDHSAYEICRRDVRCRSFVAGKGVSCEAKPTHVGVHEADITVG